MKCTRKSGQTCGAFHAPYGIDFMSTIDVSNSANDQNPALDEPGAEYDAYRAVSWSAVAAILIAIPSLLALIFPAMILLSIIALLLSVHAISTIRQRRDEFTGLQTAYVALGIALLTGIGGATVASVIYATEVPEGYERINWLMLGAEVKDGPPPPSAIELDGQMIFIKGYVLPGNGGDNMTEFVLVPDLGTCCFGGQPALTDKILVTVTNPDDGVGFSFRRRKLAGVLRVDPTWKRPDAIDGIYYELQAEYVQ